MVVSNGSSETPEDILNGRRTDSIARRLARIRAGQTRFPVRNIPICDEDDRAANPYPFCRHFTKCKEPNHRDERQLGELERLQLGYFRNRHRPRPAQVTNRASKRETDQIAKRLRRRPFPNEQGRDKGNRRLQDHHPDRNRFRCIGTTIQ